MDKKTIELLKMQLPTEIFLTKQYKGYYIRGKSINVFLHAFENQDEIDNYRGYFFFEIYALVNQDYLARAVNIDPTEKSFLSHYIGSNKRNYKKAMSGILRNLGKVELPFLSKASLIEPDSPALDTLTDSQMLQRTNKPITCNSFVIADKEAANLKIAQKDSIIPVGFIIEPKSILDIKTNKTVKPFKLRSYHVFSSNFSEATKHCVDARYQLVAEWLSVLYDTSTDVFGVPNILKSAFINLGKKVADLSYTWATTKKANKHFLEEFNTFYKSLDEIDSYLVNFYYPIIDDLVDDMFDAEAVSECEHCYSLFPFEKNKKYCSLKSEGRSCGKAVRNKKYYKRHRKRVSTRQRGETRLNRQCLKSKGVTK